MLSIFLKQKNLVMAIFNIIFCVTLFYVCVFKLCNLNDSYQDNLKEYNKYYLNENDDKSILKMTVNF